MPSLRSVHLLPDMVKGGLEMGWGDYSRSSSGCKVIKGLYKGGEGSQTLEDARVEAEVREKRNARLLVLRPEEGPGTNEQKWLPS